MRVVLLAAASSIHTVRWANGISALGHDVHVITLHDPFDPFNAEVSVYKINYFWSFGYFINVPAVKRLLAVIQPDIVNAHYAGGYGVLARLVDYHPWILSVWGADVYDVPYKSFFHKMIIQRNLQSADRIASTSHCMASQVRALDSEISNIRITPFGVDFKGYPEIKPFVPTNDKIVIGTVKSMSPKYGVDTLIRAFALLVSRMGLQEKNDLELELHLVGDGSADELKHLSQQLGVSDQTKFIGQVPHAHVPEQLSKMDIYVALSRLDSESFGVAIIEAGAAGLPVVVSDAGGLPEVVVEGETGFIVPRDCPKSAANAIEKLIFDPELRLRLGSAGRDHVLSNYSWEDSLENMISLYDEVLSKKK